MSRNNAIDMEEKLWQMTEKEQAEVLLYLGLRSIHFSCIVETRVWRVAKEFCKQSGYFTTKGITDTLELLLRTIKEINKDGE